MAAGRRPPIFRRHELYPVAQPALFEIAGRLTAAGQAPPTEVDGRSFLPLLTGQGSFVLRPHQVWFSPDRTQSSA